MPTMMMAMLMTSKKLLLLLPLLLPLLSFKGSSFPANQPLSCFMCA
jgi:hypothetical protein